MLALAAALAATFFLWWFKIDRGIPTAQLEGESEVVGRDAAWVVNVEAPGRSGLRTVSIRLISGDRIFELADRSFERTGWFGSGVDAVRIPIEVDLGEIEVPEGPATLEVLAETYGWRVLDRQTPTAGRFPQRVDRSPPAAGVASDQHNIRLGGSSLAIFRIAPDAVTMEVRVGRYRFPVTRGYFADTALALAVFAVPEDLTADVQPYLFVADAVGNTVEVPIVSHIRTRQFRERMLKVSDSFLERKIPQLFSSHGLAVPKDLLAGYLQINREMRKRSEARLAELTKNSVPRSTSGDPANDPAAGLTNNPGPRPRWDGAFQRLARAQTMSEFGDRRSYIYHGEVVDRQVHLGVDLASLKRAEVGAAQRGTVVFASDLGIYGNTVVIDHGLGVFTLYGHLSSIQVVVGDWVSTGQVVGRTGQSGLAGGDHLHYSTLVHGVHVDPVEWWDSRWLRDHIDAKLEAFPRAQDATEDRDDGEGAS